MKPIKQGSHQVYDSPTSNRWKWLLLIVATVVIAIFIAKPKNPDSIVEPTPKSTVSVPLDNPSALSDQPATSPLSP